VEDPLNAESIEKLKRAANEIKLQESTEDAIKLAREFTMQLEEYNPVVRCLVAYSLQKTYMRLWPQVFMHFEKMGI
jgi:hypothetical protein